MLDFGFDAAIREMVAMRKAMDEMLIEMKLMRGDMKVIVSHLLIEHSARNNENE